MFSFKDFVECFCTTSDEVSTEMALCKTFGKMSHMNIFYFPIDNCSNYPILYPNLIPMYAFKLNDIYYAPMMKTKNGLTPVDFYSTKFGNLNYTFINSVYRDLIKFHEYMYEFDFTLDGLYKLTINFDITNRNEPLGTGIIATKTNWMDPQYEKRSWGELGLEYMKWYNRAENPTLEDIKEDILSDFDDDIDYRDSTIEYIDKLKKMSFFSFEIKLI